MSKILSAELLGVYCYGRVLQDGLLGPRAEPVVALILEHERAHVRALEAELARLGAPAPAGPTTVVQADAELKARHSSGRLTGLHDERITLDFLYDIEAITIGAYDQALESLGDPRLVGLSATVMGVEAQHAAAIGSLLHPGRFDRIVPVDYVKGKT